MARRLINRLSHIFKEKDNNDSTTAKQVQNRKVENEETTNKTNLKREKSLSKRASLWLDSKFPKTAAGKRKRKSQEQQKQQNEISIMVPLRVWTQQEVPELSGKVEIPPSAIPISYSSFSMSQPLSSSSSSAFSNNLIVSSHIISSDQETLATVRTSIDRQDKKPVGNAAHLQRFDFEPRVNKLDLAKKVRSMLGDAISLADQELENE